MAKATIAGYSAYLANDLRQLPNLKFRDELALDHEIIFNAVMDRCDPRKLNDPTTRVSEVLKAYQAVKDSPEYQGVIDNFYDSTRKLSQSLKQAYHLLSDEITTEVDNISEETDTRLIDDPEEVEPTEDGEAIAAEKMHVFDWNRSLATLGGAETIRTYGKNVFQSKDITDSEVHRILHSEHCRAQVIEMTSEIKQELARAVKRVCKGDSELTFNALAAMETATTPNRFNEAVHYIDALDTPNISAALNHVNEFVHTVGVAIDTVSKTTFNLSDYTSKILHDNINKVKNLTMVAGYGLLLAREHYRNTLVINPTLVNCDTLNDYSRAGGTLGDAYNYVKRQFSFDANGAFPVTGITPQDILNNKARLKSLSQEEKAIHQRQSAKMKTYRLKQSLLASMENYLERLPDEMLPEQANRRDYVNAKMRIARQFVDRLDATPDENRDSILFDFVLEANYPGTILRYLHHRLAEEVVAEINKTDGTTELDPNTRDEVTANVSSEVATDFVTDNLVEPVPEE